jgi:predicted dehydrogenase
VPALLLLEHAMSMPTSAGFKSSREPVRIGVIGGGFIAQVAHLHALSRIPEARIVALAEPDDGLREAVSRLFAIESAFCAYQEILDCSDIDALVICVPRRAQSHLVTKALSGARAVLSEKPMAMTLEEATKMVSIARLAGTSWTVGYMKRYDLGVQRFSNLLMSLRASGELGAVADVHMRDFCGAYGVAAPPHVRRIGSRQIRYPEAPIAPDFIPDTLWADYEYTLNVASHDINLLRALFGDDIKPSKFLVRSNRVQRMIFEAGGFLIDLVVAPVDIGRWDQRLDVTFERGRLSLILPSPLARHESATVVLERAGNSQMITVPASEHIWSFEVQARSFVKAVRQGTDTVTSGAACLADIALIDSFWRRWNACD